MLVNANFGERRLVGRGGPFCPTNQTMLPAIGLAVDARDVFFQVRKTQVAFAVGLTGRAQHPVCPCSGTAATVDMMRPRHIFSGDAFLR
jgi:hypothetical protein